QDPHGRARGRDGTISGEEQLRIHLRADRPVHPRRAAERAGDHGSDKGGRSRAQVSAACTDSAYWAWSSGPHSPAAIWPAKAAGGVRFSHMSSNSSWLIWERPSFRKPDSHSGGAACGGKSAGRVTVLIDWLHLVPGWICRRQSGLRVHSTGVAFVCGESA